MSISKTPPSSATRHGKGWYAASARTRATHSTSGNPKTCRVVEIENDVFIETPPQGATPQGSSSPPVPAPVSAPAPAPAPAAPQATTTGTNRYAMQPGVTRAITRSQVPSPIASDYWANRNNGVALAGLFKKDMLQQLHKLGSQVSLEIAHQLDGAAFSTEYASLRPTRQKAFRRGK